MKDESGKNVKMHPLKVATRPETISDTYGHHEHYRLGKMPIGGFQSIWRFEDGGDSKTSYTSKSGGKKVY